MLRNNGYICCVISSGEICEETDMVSETPQPWMNWTLPVSNKVPYLKWGIEN